MTFDELPLYEAIHDVYRVAENPRSDSWLITDREKLLRKVQEHLPLGHPLDIEAVLRAWNAYGKSIKIENSECKKLELTVIVARRFGAKCFYAGRGLGECTNQVHVDRIVPGVRGGLYVPENCIIACSFHNGQRSDRSIEDYLTTKE